MVFNFGDVNIFINGGIAIAIIIVIIILLVRSK